jgi:predicted TIM-barrel fold metal-dependent hydrolase
MEIIDAHIHPFIDSANNIAVYGAPNTLEEYMAELKNANISMACGSVITKTEAKTFENYENVYLDISGTGLFRWNMLRHAVDICGSEKLLFGSDFPICSAAMNLQGALAEHLSDAEFDNVLCKNFKRLMGMN